MTDALTDAVTTVAVTRITAHPGPAVRDRAGLGGHVQLAGGTNDYTAELVGPGRLEGRDLGRDLGRDRVVTPPLGMPV